MLCILRLKAQVEYHTCLAFMWASGDLNSGPKAHTANALTPEPSSQHTHWVSDSVLRCLSAAMTSCCINFPFLTVIQTILLCLAISAATAPCCPASPGQTPVRSLANLGRRLMHQVCLLQLQDPPFRGSPLLPASFASPWPPVTQTQALLISQPQMSPSVMQNKHPCPQVTIRLRTRISRCPRLRGDVAGVSSY